MHQRYGSLILVPPFVHRQHLRVIYLSVTQCSLFCINEAYLIISAYYTRCLPNMVGAMVVMQRVPEIARLLRQKPQGGEHRGFCRSRRAIRSEERRVGK